MMNDNEQIELISCFISKNGTLNWHKEGYLEYIPHEHVTTFYKEELEREYKWIMRTLAGKKVPFLTHNQRLTNINREEINFMMNVTTNFVSAFATVVSNGISKFIFHSLSYFHRPQYPYLITTDKDKAKAWILEQLKKQNPL